MKERAISEVPTHVQETVDAIAALHIEHDRKSSVSERFFARVAASIATPVFLGIVTIFVVCWLLVNELLRSQHVMPTDRPPFSLLQGILTLLAVYISLSILAAQRRANALADLRAKLTLEHAILAEQKAAKAIALLEELRRDDPLIKDRSDPEAKLLSNTVDTTRVAEAINQASETKRDVSG